MKQTEIKDFLVEFKGMMSKGCGLDIVNRRENIETVTKLHKLIVVKVFLQSLAMILKPRKRLWIIFFYKIRAKSLPVRVGMKALVPKARKIRLKEP